MRRSIDDATDDHPADDDERPPVSWAVALSDDCDTCGMGSHAWCSPWRRSGRAGLGLVAHLAPRPPGGCGGDRRGAEGDRGGARSLRWGHGDRTRPGTGTVGAGLAAAARAGGSDLGHRGGGVGGVPPPAVLRRRRVHAGRLRLVAR